MNQKSKTQRNVYQPVLTERIVASKLFAEVCETVAANRMSENVWRILCFSKRRRYLAVNNLMTYLRWNGVIHVSTFLMITLAVLAARHLPFAAPALLVDAATFTRTLEQRESWIMTWFASQVIYLQLPETVVQWDYIFSVSRLFKTPQWNLFPDYGRLWSLWGSVSLPQLLWVSWTPCVPSRASQDATRPLPRLPPHWGTSAPRCRWWYSAVL